MIGYNIHGHRGVNKDKLFRHVANLPPTPHVVLDAPDLAWELQQHTGQTVYHRKLTEIESDDNIHRRMTPEHFVRYVQPEIDMGLGIYIENEPSWSQECLDWLLAVAKLLVAQNARGVLGNFSIGTPELDVFERAAPLIRYIQKHGDVLALGLHEGGLNHWTNLMVGIDHTNIHDFDVQTTVMDYTGRCLRFYDAFGWFPIIITEWTWDGIAGNPDGAPIHGIAPIWDRLYGRRDTEEFAAQQVAEVLEHVYTPFNIPICMFCYGAAVPRWERYDFSAATVFQQELEHLLKPKESPMATKTYQIETNTSVNIRVDPTTNAARIGSLVNGDVIQVHMQGEQPDIIEAEGYKWMHVIKGDVEGYAASDFFTLVAPASSIKQELQALVTQLQSTISRLD